MTTMKKSIGAPSDFSPNNIGRTTTYHGTYVGVIKDNRDEQRMGRLKVWIPELGGDPSDSTSWFIVQYASPFAGASPFKFTGPDNQSHTDSQSAYGMWFIPPDVDNEVLVTFIGGQLHRGVWFGCLYQTFMNHSVPGVSASENNTGSSTGEDAPLPSNEYNRKVSGDRQFTSPCQEEKVVNPHKAGGLTKQGTVSDNIRGTNDSSSRRDANGTVFGISTPGPTDLTTDDNLPYKKYDDVDIASPVARKGGHSFIMDDGHGTEHIQLQTRSGARIRIDETFGIIYLINRDGTAWIELSEEGNVDIYGAESFSVRSGLDINLRADRDVNIEAGQNITMKAAREYVSHEDVVRILTEYANTQGKTIQGIFTRQQKIEYITDFKEFKKMLDGGADVDQVFIKTLRHNGFPVQGQPSLTFSPAQTEPSHTTLQSVDLLHLIRGSRIIGEKFGSGGNIQLHANADMSSYAEQGVTITAATDNLDINVGEDTNITSGVNTNFNTGENLKMASGKETHITTGEDLVINVLENLELNVEFLSHITLKEDVHISMPGSTLNIATPNSTANIEFGTVNVKAQDLVVSSSTMDLSSSGAMSIASSNNMQVSSGGNMHLAAPSGSWRAYGSSMRIDASSSLIGRAPNVDVNDGGPSSLPATPATILPGVAITPALLAQIGPIAKMAAPPTLWSKQNVLPTLQRVGNREFAITYHTQPVESIVSRFMTHEPCVEHTTTATQQPIDNLPVRTENVMADPNKNYKAFLDMIAWAEGTSTIAASQDGYNVMFGNKIFTDYSNHPFDSGRAKIGFTDTKGRKSTSSGAGRYQFLIVSWREQKQALKLPDFKPDSQERAVLNTIKVKRGAYKQVIEGDLRNAIRLCCNEWASFPGNAYSQRPKTYEQLEAKFIEFGGVVKPSRRVT